MGASAKVRGKTTAFLFLSITRNVIDRDYSVLYNRARPGTVDDDPGPPSPGQKTTERMKNTLVLLSAIFVLVANSAANIFTVNKATDPGDGVCDTTDCTLREAMNAANAHPGADTIVFDISGAGLHTIKLTDNFPAITHPVTIDGYTQPGASLNTAAAGDNAIGERQ